MIKEYYRFAMKSKQKFPSKNRGGEDKINHRVLIQKQYIIS